VYTRAPCSQRRGDRRDRSPQTNKDIKRGTHGNIRRQGIHHRRNQASNKSIDHEKSTGEDGITSKMWTFGRFPQLVTSLYNGGRGPESSP
jgi:hypothetical protein